jgi:hypothetical protein
VTQNVWQEMLPVNRVEDWTLFSLRVQGSAVTTKMPDKNQVAVE